MIFFNVYFIYVSISARDFKPDKNGCLFIKHYINATSFKIIQLDARRGVLGQVAVNRKGFRAEFFSAKVLFKVLLLVERDRNTKLFKFSHDVFYFVNLRLKSGSMWFFRDSTFQVEQRFGKNSTTAALDKDENLLRSGL